jgi:hypothetical protein
MRNIACLLVLPIFLSGCSVVAAPCRITGAVVKIVPVIGDPVGEVLELCGDMID